MHQTGTERAEIGTARALQAVGAVLLSVAFLLTGHGLQQTLLPIRGGLEGFSSFGIGLLGSFYFGGYVIGCLAAPRIIIRSGHVRTFAALIALAVSAALLHAVLVHPVAWMICRVVTGICLAGLYLVIESWLNERADNRTRGTIMAAYLTVNLLMITVGQMIVPLLDPASFAQLSIAAIAISLAAVPIALTTTEQPAPVTLVRFRPRALFALSPAGVAAIFMIGVSNGSFWSLGPSYGQQIGLSVTETAVFMSLAVIGGAAVQYPVGLLSDRIDRRLVLIALAGASVVLGAALSGIVPLAGTTKLVIAFFFGAAILPIYTVAAAHVFDFARPEGYVEVSAGLLLLFGIGSVLGPIPASLLMQSVSPGALFAFMAAAYAVLIGYVAYRLRRRDALPSDEKEDYRLANVAPVAVVADAQAFEESPLVVDPTASVAPLPDEALGMEEEDRKAARRH